MDKNERWKLIAEQAVLALWSVVRSGFGSLGDVQHKEVRTRGVAPLCSADSSARFPVRLAPSASGGPASPTGNPKGGAIE